MLMILIMIENSMEMDRKLFLENNHLAPIREVKVIYGGLKEISFDVLGMEDFSDIDLPTSQIQGYISSLSLNLLMTLSNTKSNLKKLQDSMIDIKMKNNIENEEKSADCKISNLMSLFLSIEQELQELIDLRKRKRRAETDFDSAARDATQVMADFRSSNTREVNKIYNKVLDILNTCKSFYIFHFLTILKGICPNAREVNLDNILVLGVMNYENARIIFNNMAYVCLDIPELGTTRGGTKRRIEFTCEESKKHKLNTDPPTGNDDLEYDSDYSENLDSDRENNIENSDDEMTDNDNVNTERGRNESENDNANNERENDSDNNDTDNERERDSEDNDTDIERERDSEDNGTESESDRDNENNDTDIEREDEYGDADNDRETNSGENLNGRVPIIPDHDLNGDIRDLVGGIRENEIQSSLRDEDDLQAYTKYSRTVYRDVLTKYDEIVFAPTFTFTPTFTALTPSTHTPTVTALIASTTTPTVTALTPSIYTPTVTAPIASTTTPTVTALTPSIYTPTVTALIASTTTPTVTALTPSTTTPTFTADTFTETPTVTALTPHTHTSTITSSVTRHLRTKTDTRTIIEFSSVTMCPELNIINNQILPTNVIQLKFERIRRVDFKILIRTMFSEYSAGRLPQSKIALWARQIDKSTIDIMNQIKLFKAQNNGVLVYNPFVSCSKVKEDDILVKYNKKLFISTKTFNNLIQYQPPLFCSDYCLRLDIPNYVGSKFPPEDLKKAFGYNRAKDHIVRKDDIEYELDPCISDKTNDENCSYIRMARKESTLLYDNLKLVCPEDDVCNYRNDNDEFVANQIVSALDFLNFYLNNFTKVLDKIEAVASDQNSSQYFITGIFFAGNFGLFIIIMVVRYCVKMCIAKRQTKRIRKVRFQQDEIELNEIRPLNELNDEIEAGREITNDILRHLQEIADAPI